MAFSKFEPHRKEPESSTRNEEKAMLLKWWNWVTLFMTVVGFLFIGYWLAF